MYHAFYLYRVANPHVERFLKIVGEASAIYRRQARPAASPCGWRGIRRQIRMRGLFENDAPTADEQLFVGIDSFRNAEEFRTIVAQIDANPEIGRLYQEIQEVVDFKKLIRWEAEDTD